MILQSSFDRIVQTQWGWLQKREEVCRDHIWKNRSSPRGPDPSLPSTEATWTAGWEARSMSVLTGQWGREEGCCPWGLWDTTQQWVPAGERAWRGLRRAQESCALVSPHMARRSSLAGGTFPRVFLVGGHCVLCGDMGPQVLPASHPGGLISASEGKGEHWGSQVRPPLSARSRGCGQATKPESRASWASWASSDAQG